MTGTARCVALLILMTPSFALTQQAPPPEPPPTHDISKVDPAPLGGAIAVPLPEQQRRRLRKYDLDELAGSKQAIGSQLIDGRLPRPLLDYSIHGGMLDQRLSIFEGGLVVVRMTGAGGTIQKRVIIPLGALKKYLEAAAPEKMATIGPREISQPAPNRAAFLRVYRLSGDTGVLTAAGGDTGAPPSPRQYVERVFDPAGGHPKLLHDAIIPLEDLLRAISEDRNVTNTVARYDPKVGDELVSDDRKTWRVERVMQNGDVVQLRCTSQPMVIYVAKKDLYNYFVGRAGN